MVSIILNSIIFNSYPITGFKYSEAYPVKCAMGYTGLVSEQFD